MASKSSVLKQLKQAHIKPLVPLDLPREDDLIDIEESIYVQLRGDFRDYLLEASDLCVGRLEPVTAADPHSHTYLPEVAAQAWDAGLPRELLPICQTDNGYYCLDLEDQVVLWQDGETDPGSWPSFWAWAEDAWLNS